MNLPTSLQRHGTNRFLRAQKISTPNNRTRLLLLVKMIGAASAEGLRHWHRRRCSCTPSNPDAEPSVRPNALIEGINTIGRIQPEPAAPYRASDLVHCGHADIDG
jgi:hypothetical protein